VPNANTDIEDKSEKLKSYFPITIFIALTFLLQVFEITKATNLIISVFVSLISFSVMSAMMREKHGELPVFKPLQKRMGLLSAVFLLILVNGFLHWNQIFHSNIRWALFLLLMLIYFIILFNSVNLLYSIKKMMLEKDKKGKK